MASTDPAGATRRCCRSAAARTSRRTGEWILRTGTEKKAAGLSKRWAEAQLNGLGDDESLVIKWIRLSDGQRPDIAVELAGCGISPGEAGLCIGHGGRIDPPRLGTIYERFRDRKVGRSEATAIVRQWRAKQQAL